MNWQSFNALIQQNWDYDIVTRTFTAKVVVISLHTEINSFFIGLRLKLTNKSSLKLEYFLLLSSVGFHLTSPLKHPHCLDGKQLLII